MSAANRGEAETVPCCICEKPVCTKELDEPGADPNGSGLSDGRWVCSGECWDKATGLVEPLSEEAERIFHEAVAKLDACPNCTIAIEELSAAAALLRGTQEPSERGPTPHPADWSAYHEWLETHGLSAAQEPGVDGYVFSRKAWTLEEAQRLNVVQGVPHREIIPVRYGTPLAAPTETEVAHEFVLAKEHKPAGVTPGCTCGWRGNAQLGGDSREQWRAHVESLAASE